MYQHSVQNTSAQHERIMKITFLCSVSTTVRTWFQDFLFFHIHLKVRQILEKVDNICVAALWHRFKSFFLIY